MGRTDKKEKLTKQLWDVADTLQGKMNAPMSFRLFFIRYHQGTAVYC
jgi:hypothetical protein